uniref:CAO protein n=1 Tax=Nephroselmis pyriformis TaxID=156128 RepID=A0A0C6E3T8_9CHLO|nr:chlorophyllide a oxygenase [Nephroselmis pyriformis]
MMAGSLLADAGAFAGVPAVTPGSAVASRRGVSLPSAASGPPGRRGLRIDARKAQLVMASASFSEGKPAKYPKTNLEVIENDVSFISERLSNDSSVTVDALVAARDQMLQLLGRKTGSVEDVEELKRQVQMLQAELQTAQAKAELAEMKLSDSLSKLAEVEEVSSVLESTVAMPEAPTQEPDVTERALESFDDDVGSSRTRGYIPPGNRKKLNGLQTNLSTGNGLKNFWYAIEFTSRLKDDMLVPMELFGEPWVLFRDGEGGVGCVYDACAHRACPLSLGKIENGNVQCAYHGWEFNTEGECEKIPSVADSKKSCKGVGVRSIPVREVEGMIFVWPGDREPDSEPHMGLLPGAGQGYENHAEIVLDVPVEHGLLLENLLDLAHAPFTHTSTFAKGWPVPDLVKWTTDPLQALAGAWEPYPITMSFEPPCMVLSTIGLAQPGKIRRGLRAEECEKHLHQLHVCVPSKPGHTRLLYRMHLDFLPWAKHIPGMHVVWEQMANQVLGEDLRLVAGQQDRMERGDDVWGSPVIYDKLGVRYRRWRNETQGEV